MRIGTEYNWKNGKEHEKERERARAPEIDHFANRTLDDANRLEQGTKTTFRKVANRIVHGLCTITGAAAAAAIYAECTLCSLCVSSQCPGASRYVFCVCVCLSDGNGVQFRFSTVP